MGSSIRAKTYGTIKLYKLVILSPFPQFFNVFNLLPLTCISMLCHAFSFCIQKWNFSSLYRLLIKLINPFTKCGRANEDFHSSFCAVKCSQRTITTQNLISFCIGQQWIVDSSAVSYIFPRVIFSILSSFF